MRLANCFYLIFVLSMVQCLKIKNTRTIIDNFYVVIKAYSKPDVVPIAYEGTVYQPISQNFNQYATGQYIFTYEIINYDFNKPIKFAFKSSGVFAAVSTYMMKDIENPIFKTIVGDENTLYCGDDATVLAGESLYYPQATLTNFYYNKEPQFYYISEDTFKMECIYAENAKSFKTPIVSTEASTDVIREDEC